MFKLIDDKSYLTPSADWLLNSAVAILLTVRHDLINASPMHNGVAIILDSHLLNSGSLEMRKIEALPGRD